MTTLLLDTHAVHWFTAEPDRLSTEASQAIDEAEELAVADITWWELAWLAHNGRITLTVPPRTWLHRLSEGFTTIRVGPEVADTAAALPASFPGDPADRLIYATAIETGWRLVTKDRRLREHPQPRTITVW